VENENISLYAKWTENEYTITYNLDSGSNDGDNPATFGVTDLPIVLAAATKAEKSFGGWYTDAEFTTPLADSTISSVGNKTVYAKWDTFEITALAGEGVTAGAEPPDYAVTIADDGSVVITATTAPVTWDEDLFALTASLDAETYATVGIVGKVITVTGADNGAGTPTLTVEFKKKSGESWVAFGTPVTKTVGITVTSE
jgi:uncharacterized repeat protein (TIGR02543 family)